MIVMTVAMSRRSDLLLHLKRMLESVAVDESLVVRRVIYIRLNLKNRIDLVKQMIESCANQMNQSNILY